MLSPARVIESHATRAIRDAFGEEYAGVDPIVRPSQFADFQLNAAPALATRLGLPPRTVAEQLLERLDLDGICSAIELSGPGFLNLTLDDEWIAAQVNTMASDPRLGVPQESSQRIVIDYSAPNVAKEMHVGHLRTTVVGDALARILEHLGHEVIRQNHVGDWGTPFGMLIARLIDVGRNSPEAMLVTTDPNAFYQAARAEFDRGGDFAERARARVVMLQSGDPATLALWRELVDMSKIYFTRVYRELGVTLTEADLAGESTYNDDLPAVCDELLAAGIATVSDGALCVFLDGFLGRDDRPLPLIIRKSDGGYGYATTDLAAIRRRAGALRADRIVYVIGVTQTLHLTMVWEAARKAGWLHGDVQVAHVQIGSVLGEDHKILKTKYGSSPPLTLLLDEAVERADEVLATARPDLDAVARAAITRNVAIGAVKWADLSVAHESDYVFELGRMTSLTGNTGPYLQYAVSRIRSIFAKCSDTPGRVAPAADPAERALALALLDFGSTVADVGAGYTPHRLCSYLFDLAQRFSVFYEHCPVLKADSDVRAARLGLCEVVQRVLETGLNLLGIEIPAEM